MNPKQSLLAYCQKISLQKNPSGFDQVLSSLLKKIPGDFADPNDTTFYDYDGLKRLNASGQLMHAFSDDLSMESTPEEKNFFLVQFKSRQQNIWNMRERLFDPTQTCLEIGCGILDNGGFSFLTSSIPRAIAKNFSYCEINPKAIEKSKLNCPEARIQFADVLEIEKYYPKNSFDNIAGINVLDTFDSVDLRKALKQIRKILKPQGKLTHILNMEPFFCAIYHDMAKDSQMFVPYMPNDSQRKAIIIPKDKWPSLHRQLSGKQILSEGSLNFLDYVSGLSGVQQERLWVGLNALDSKASMEMIGKALSASGYKAVSTMEMFMEGYRDALKECGFGPLERWEDSTAAQINVSPGHPWGGHSIECGPQGILRIPASDLGPDKVDVTISTLFSVAAAS